MTGPEPKFAEPIAAQPTTILPWEFVRGIRGDARLYWLATVHPAGRPRVRPVLAALVRAGAVFRDGVLIERPGPAAA